MLRKITKSDLKRVSSAFLIALAIVLTACGQPDEASDSQLSSNPATSLYLGFGQMNATGVALQLSAPAGYQRAIFCVGNVTACAEGQPGSVAFSKIADRPGADAASSRVIFQSGSLLQISSGGVLVVVAYGNGVPALARKVQFVAKSVAGGAAVSSGALNWKMVLMASDVGNQSNWIDAFDNARVTLRNIFMSKRVPAQNIRELSLKPQHINASVAQTSLDNLRAQINASRATSPNDACLVYMTSHGGRDGFALGNARLRPADLGAAMDNACGSRPQVLLISACYSGLYALESSGLRKPNRIIMTAARHDRTSFGCSPENEYTYWDGCLIAALPTASTWAGLAETVKQCIVRKEGGLTPSEPQTFIGSEVQNLPVPR